MAIKNSFTLPEYTYDNFQAQMDWNREIKNNKQGYLAVDIMPMKDFYDAGGYAFVNDYKAELAAVDAAYDRALPSYGAQGEQMAKAGLQGSGYSDYLAGQAYATRAAGQAVARQNAMANSNSFRAAYNQYVAQQKEKREANLQSVIERAQSVNMNPDNFVEIAKKLGIPEEDAKRGKEALIAYYMGIGKVDSNGKPITGGTASGTTGNTNAVWGNVSTEEQNAAIKGVYQSILGGMTGLADSDGNVIMPQYSTIDAMVKSEYGSQYSTESPEVQEAIRQFAASRVSDIEGWVARGEINGAKQQLDQLAEYGVFGKDGQNSEQYQATLGKIQDAVAKEATVAIQNQDISGIAKLLNTTEDKLTDEELSDFIDILYENKMIDEKQKNILMIEDAKSAINTIENGTELQRYIYNIYDNKETYGDKLDELYTPLNAYVSDMGDSGTIEVTDGKGNKAPMMKYTWGFKTISNEKIGKKGKAVGEVSYYDGDLYAYNGLAWTKLMLDTGMTAKKREMAEKSKKILELVTK